MFGPVRLWYALRRRPDAGLLAGAIAVAVLFSATPFIVSPIADDFGVSIGTAGLVSTAQVGGFALTVFIAGRVLRTHRRFLVAASLTAVATNLLSVVVTSFPLMLAVRTLAGCAAGIFVWLAWANAMQTSDAMRNVAATGPLAVLVAAPIVSALADANGADAVFIAIAVASLPPLFLRVRLGAHRPLRHKMSPSRSNVVLMLALAVLTLAGSALFVFAARIGHDLGIDPIVVSLGFSLNALAGFIAARRRASDSLSPVWLFATAASAGAVAFTDNAVVFMLGLAGWGYAFWIATPNVLRAVASWSIFPDERVGDAQSAMAIGRAAGPAIAALLVSNESFTAVGVFSVTGLAVSGTIVLLVRRYRQSHSPPDAIRAAAHR